MNKPHIKADQAALMYRAIGMMNSLRNSRVPFAGVSGMDPMADTKHDKAWVDYGWPQHLTPWMYWNMFRRLGVAHCVVKTPVDICWMTKPEIKEASGDNTETVFEREIKRLTKRLKLNRAWRGFDLRNRVGRYAGLLLTVADGQTLDKPVGRVSADAIVRVQPLYEAQLQVATTEQDRKSPRYGMPVTYSLNEGNVGDRNEHAVAGGTIHYTRVITFAEGADDGSIYGIPSLEPIFNSLIDFTKIKGSGGEGFWRAAAQRFVLEAAKETNSKTPKEDELDDLADMVADMFAGFDAIPYTGGWNLKPLSTDMPNPKEAGQLIKEDIAAGSGIPLKIIFGTQTGVKAGDEDTAHFMRQMQSRRENSLTDMIESFVDWLDEYTTLKVPSDYIVEWDDLTAPSAVQKAELGIKMMQANKDARAAGQVAPFSENEVREAFGYEKSDELEADDDLPAEVDVDVDEAEIDA